MIPELKIMEGTPAPKRIVPKDVTVERLDSLRKSVIDFCKRAKSTVDPMGVWSYFSQILRGQAEGDLWWILDGNHVSMFSVIKVNQDFDGKWTAYVQFGWSDSSAGRNSVKPICEDYFRNGVARIQFVSRRNPLVFERWLGTDWKPVATTFELRR
jgi:hypothetical protein